MSEIKAEEWVDRASEKTARELRQAIRTVITAIAGSRYLFDRMVVKGGVLLALKYNSSRFTKDVDFSTCETYDEFDKEKFFEELDYNLIVAVEKLGYDLDLKIQSHELRPGEGGTYPTLTLKIGYAYKGTPRHKRLIAGSCPNILIIDYSFNEENTTAIDYIQVDDSSLRAYSIVDLVAEKYRAFLQQAVRNRWRRQDLYDIHFLLEKKALATVDKGQVLRSMLRKAESRELKLSRESILDEEIAERAENTYEYLQAEIEGDLPPFSEVYNKTVNYYLSLPWDELEESETGMS